MTRKIPKNKMYRALYKSGLANDIQIREINRKLGHDRQAAQKFQKLWRQEQGHRFIGSIVGFALWLKRHWPEIKIALGIVALFLDEEKDAKDQKVVEDKVYTAPPAPKKVDTFPKTSVTPAGRSWAEEQNDKAWDQVKDLASKPLAITDDESQDTAEVVKSEGLTDEDRQVLDELLAEANKKVEDDQE